MNITVSQKNGNSHRKKKKGGNMKIDKLHSQHTVEIPSTTANREHTKLAHGKFAEDQEFNILKNTEAKSL